MTLLKSKKVIISAAIIAAILVAGIVWTTVSASNKKEAEEQYLKDSEKTVQKMLDIGANAEDIAMGYLETWHDAINSRYLDFNEELQTLYTSYENNGVYDDLTEGVSKVKKGMSGIKDYPDKYEGLYDDTVELYGTFKRMAELAEDPTGSYESYKADFQKYQNEFMDKYEKMEVKYFD